MFALDKKIPGVVFDFDLFKSAIDWIRSTSYVALPWLCCFIAERFYSGWRAALWSCVVLSIQDAVQFIELTGSGIHGNVTIGMRFTFGTLPPLLPLLTPLAVFAIYRLWRFRDEYAIKPLTSTEL
jgi:hypothetical protein